MMEPHDRSDGSAQESAFQPRGDRSVEPSSDATAAEAADELVVQGLLESVHRKDAATRESRLAQVMLRLENGNSPSGLLLRRVGRWGISLAASIALVVGLLVIGLPGEPKALALVHESIAAMRVAGDRRYEVSMGLRDGDDASADVNAIIDMRPPNLLLIRHRPPGWNRYALSGRDAGGEWAIRSDGSVIRENARREWPPFVTDGGEAFMIDPIDKQLADLPEQFGLAKGPAQRIGDSDPTMFDRITATRKVQAGPRPSHVDLWIHPATKLIERIEYRWEGAEGPSPGDLRSHDVDDEAGDRERRGGGEGIVDEPEGLMERSSARGPGPGRTRHDHGGPFPDDHTHDHGIQNRPGGKGGPAGHPGRSPVMSGPQGGRLAGGPPGAGRVVTFQRVEAPALAADWFTPQGHAGE